MDVATTVALFVRWLADHEATCGAQHFASTWELRNDATFMVMKCPACGDTTRGSVPVGEWGKVVALLHSRSEN